MYWVQRYTPPDGTSRILQNTSGTLVIVRGFRDDLCRHVPDGTGAWWELEWYERRSSDTYWPYPDSIRIRTLFSTYDSPRSTCDNSCTILLLQKIPVTCLAYETATS